MSTKKYLLSFFEEINVLFFFSFEHNAKEPLTLVITLNLDTSSERKSLI